MDEATKESLRFNSWTLGGRGADLFEKSAEALALERLNPLRGVDEWRLGQIFDDARDGVYADLAWLYNEIEGVEPALLTCCDARESAASECGWLVRTADADRVRGFDQTLADEQRAALLAEYGAVEDDLAELAGHLVSAFFRGAAHAHPLWNADGSLAGFQHLDLWNFALDRKTGLWYWNADASRDEGSFQAIPPGELVTLAATRHVDHAALPIFIRAALGAKRYGVWLDRFGIPPVGVIMPPNAEKGDQAAYMDLARKFARGGSGILPNGSQIVYGTEARAVCPFTDFIRFQQQQIYTVGLGRVQSGDNAGENLGGNAAGVVDGAFRRIVRRDARRIARAINDGVTAKILARLFPGRPALAQFAWDTDEKRTGREVLEDAGLARNAGLAIDLDQLRELTGYQLEKAPETPSPSLFPGLNSATPLQTALQGVAKREEGSGRTTTPESGDAPQRAILAAFAKDTSKAAEAVKALLAEEDPSKLKALSSKLLADLPSLIPEDPALAAVIAEAMAAEFSDGRARTPSAPPDAVKNMREYKREKDGKFSEVDHPTDFKPGKNPDSAETQAAEIGKGKAALAKCLAEKCDVPDAVSRGDIGIIGFRYGDEKGGIAHFAGRADTLHNLSETIVRGEAGNPYQDGQKLNITHGPYTAVLTLTNDPAKSDRPKQWILTAFGPEDKKGSH